MGCFCWRGPAKEADGRKELMRIEKKCLWMGENHWRLERQSAFTLKTVVASFVWFDQPKMHFSKPDGNVLGSISIRRFVVFLCVMQTYFSDWGSAYSFRSRFVWGSITPPPPPSNAIVRSHLLSDHLGVAFSFLFPFVQSTILFTFHFGASCPTRSAPCKSPLFTNRAHLSLHIMHELDTKKRFCCSRFGWCIIHVAISPCFFNWWVNFEI